MKRTRTLLLLLCAATLLCNPGYLQRGNKNGCSQGQSGQAKSVRSRYAVLQAEGDVHLEGEGIVLAPGTVGNGLTLSLTYNVNVLLPGRRVRLLRLVSREHCTS